MRATFISPRVRRLRLRCLAELARRRGLPVPAEPAFVDGRDALTLVELLRAWEDECRSLTEGRTGGDRSTRGRRWWRRPAIIYAASALVLGAAGVAALVRPPLARREVHVDVPPVWMPVGDSTIVALRGKLLAAGDARAPLLVSLSASDLAAMTFGYGERRRWAVRSGLTARADSMLWLRGMTGDGHTFTIGALVRVARPGLGELQVRRAAVDSDSAAVIDPARTRLAAAIPYVDRLGRVRFPVPRFVREIELRPSGPVLFIANRSIEQRR